MGRGIRRVSRKNTEYVPCKKCRPDIPVIPVVDIDKTTPENSTPEAENLASDIDEATPSSSEAQKSADKNTTPISPITPAPGEKNDGTTPTPTPMDVVDNDGKD